MLSHYVKSGPRLPALSVRRITICLLLAAAVFLAFSPVLRNQFTGYDDPDYVTNNPHVVSGLSAANIAWAFANSYASNWHPLTWISHSLDCALYGLNPTGHHLTSLLLHIANTILLFLWLSGLTGATGRSAFVALAFGLHPVHVEPVAWVAERKDVLSTLFWMLTLLAYTAYVRRHGTGRYLTVAALFTAGLLAKPMLVTVPLLLLLLDWWPLARKENASRLVLEKLPLVALAALSSAATIWAQGRGGSLVALDRLPLELRLANAALSYTRYLGKTFWPVDLAAFYPFPVRGIPAWEVAGSVAALALATWLAYRARHRRPWLAAGWCWYVLTLLPVIGIVQVGMQSIADRYLYVPMIGLLIAVAWQVGEVCQGSQRRTRIATAAGGFVLGICAVLSWRQAHVWRDGVTLFTHAIQVTEDNFVAHDNLGVELDRLGRSEEALAEYRETLRIRPGDRHGEENFAQASFAKGERLLGQGDVQGALAAFRDGLRYRPRNAVALLSLGVALARSGQPVEARKAFEDSVRSDPSSVEAHYDLGLVREALGAWPEALESYNAALRLKPEFGAAQAARAEVLYALGRYREAWDALLAARAAHADVDPGLAARIRMRSGK
ncbi:MAG: tetratricopeptide repeat protein [Bryobacteraceae bacterium]